MTEYDVIRIETYTVTRILKVKRMSSEEIDRRSAELMSCNIIPHTTKVGEKIYPAFQIDQDECWELKKSCEVGTHPCDQCTCDKAKSSEQFGKFKKPSK